MNKKIPIAEKKQSAIEKDFENVKRVLNGEPVPLRTAKSSKLHTIAFAVMEYATESFYSGCVKVYNLYSISPQKRKDHALIVNAKGELREAAKLYRASKKQNSLFFQNFQNIIASRPS